MSPTPRRSAFDTLPESRRDELNALLKDRILVLDGATGTTIQAMDLGPEDFGGEALDGCNEHLVLTRPDKILEMHAGFLEAGADIIETNTFGATDIVLAEYDLADKALEINRQAARLARQAAEAASTPARPRFVAGSMGPTTKSIMVTGGVTFDQLVESYRQQAEGLVGGGADLLLVETAQDTLNVKAALVGLIRLFEQLGRRVPVMVSGTIEAMGTMLAGQDAASFVTSLEHFPLLSVGLNCATGPEFMTDHLRTLATLSDRHISCYPNAGLPDEEGRYHETPESFVTKLERFVEAGWLNIIGGCCGTTYGHVRMLAQMVDGRRPRRPNRRVTAALSGLEYQAITDEARPLLVGERTNVVGSRKFKKLIAAEEFERAAEIGRKQVRAGAQLVDICLANPDRDERSDTIRFVEKLVRKVKAPVLIDSTDAEVIEEALKRLPGKCLINSINLEDGEQRFAEICPLLKTYGGAVIVGCIDEDPTQAMAVTRARKLAIARRSYDLLTNKYGLPGRDLVFDPLVFPIGTGDENYVGSAEETIEGLRLIKQELPDVKTVLGISNVSFGLPTAGREVLNAVFLYHCTRAGLDLAIVNTEKLERYASIPEEERTLADDLLFGRVADPITPFAAHFRGKSGRKKRKRLFADLPLEKRLAAYIVEGTKEGLHKDLDEALTQFPDPLAIVNGPLMAGMDEVGRLFNDNELIVAEVLESAEAMKAAVNHLEPHMERRDSASRGRVMLATVKGDVHDIGKNLVDIILSNNGYQVINLGIKIPPEALIKAYREHQPDLIGLSGLLVKSARMMVDTAGDLAQAGVSCPILVGGAALTRRFTDLKIQAVYQGPVVYAKDAMNGLDLANRLVDEQGRQQLLSELAARRRAYDEKPRRPKRPPASPRRQVVRPAAEVTVPAPPDLTHHQLDDFDLAEILRYINPAALYGQHLGLKGRIQTLWANKDPKALELKRKVEALEDEVLAAGLLKPRACYRFFPIHAEGDSIAILDRPGGQVVEQFTFPRQPGPGGLCLSDFVTAGPGQTDYLAAFVTTLGDGVREMARQFLDEGSYFKGHAIQVLALEGAEAFAEVLHRRLRAAWGFPDPPELSLQDIFKARYRGIRVSFGYPACPELEDQAILWRLLKPERIGVELTDGFMMDPEASVSALVFHHPDAHYFSAT